MSGLLAGKVWHSALDPDLKPLAATLADIADDDGTSIYPSVKFIAWRLGRAESTVREGMRKLRDAKILVVVAPGGGRSKPTEYRMDEHALPKRAPWQSKPSDNRSVSQSKNPPVCTAKLSGLQGKTLRPTGPDPSLPVRDPSEAAPIDQAKMRRAVPSEAVENPERQFNQQLKTHDRENSLLQNWWPGDPLRADLFGGLHSGFEGKTGMHAIAKAFCDSQRLTFKEQLRECVSAAVTTLSLARTGKLMVLNANDIEKHAVSKLESAGDTLHTLELVKDFASRSRLVTQYVARIVVESAAELLEARPVSGCADAAD